MSFEALGLIEPLLRALLEEGYTTPTSIQTQAIPHILKDRDLLGCAQTGTGKTAAFALPILQYLSEKKRIAESRFPNVLVLAPTRELAAQIDESFRAYGRYLGIKSTVIFGGVGFEKQTRALRAGVHVLVATPGRLLDLMGQGEVDISDIETFVLDEADRMLDMGFIHDVRKIMRELPRNKQTLLFSATMPEEIRSLADDLMSDPVKVAVTPVASTAKAIEQSVYFVEKANKRGLLVHLAKDPNLTRALVFSRTKHGANRISDHLEKAGISATAIHGNKSQNARERALAGFKAGDIRILVATDIAARGIDVDGVTHVINFDLPNEPESYVHRIGRTARAGASGTAWAFCDRDERSLLAAIERITREKIPVVEDHPFRGAPTAEALSDERAADRRPPMGRGRGGGGGRSGGGGGRSGGGGGRGGGGSGPRSGGGRGHRGGGPNRGGGSGPTPGPRQ
ncbi:MAG: DEAD/DEAH box helicase [Sandaracinaceae bacterium]|nr:DEAD/DEAH box helicase [Sandaracinaceae bacterium]